MNITEKAIHHKNPFVRMGARILLRAPRKIRYWLANEQAYRDSSPLMANSFPKSGTHLLEQIVAALPHRSNYGTFLASMTSSRTFRERSLQQTERFIRSIVPGELIRAHLFYHRDVERWLKERNAVHFFIYRDPRDVVISEAHYLFKMNRWHRMHPHFLATGSLEDSISLSIHGLDDKNLNYPNICERFERYEGWLRCENAFSVKYEGLARDHRNATIEKMFAWYAATTNVSMDIEQTAATAVQHISASKSHTFRKGGSTWASTFSEKHKSEFKRVAGQLLIDLGYETSLDW